MKPSRYGAWLTASRTSIPLRSQDLARLRVLKFIEGSAGEPSLTADGKQRFDALPKAAALTDFEPHEELVAAMARLLGESRR
jgi:hypothetical protein